MTTDPAPSLRVSRTLMSEEATRFARDHDQAVGHFRSGLMRLWQERGRPHPDEMAARTQIPESVFAIFLADTAMTAMPSRREVEALLAGLNVPPDARDGWLERYERLKDARAELDRRRVAQNRAAEGLPPEPRGLEDLVGSGPVPVMGPLAAALEATTVVQLQAALRDLRTMAGLSYARLAAATDVVPGDYVLSRSTAHRIETDPDRVPTKDQVKAFAKACGETSNTNLRLWGRAAEQVQRAVTAGPTTTTPEVTEQLEVYRHPVRYVLGKRSEEEVLSELRVRITPKVKTAVAASIFAGTITAAGRVLVRSHRPARALMIASIGGYACGVVTKNSSLDESVERVIGRKLSTVKLEERIAAALARVTLAITPKGLWETKNGRRFLRK